MSYYWIFNIKIRHFFFSSRRRHTRWPRDWSSDVCSSDLSFPSDYGMGDFGKGARKFIDFLKTTGQTVWQILPLTPVGYGDSPYTSYSAFAGNHYLISPEDRKSVV